MTPSMFDIAILDAGGAAVPAVVFARCGSDIALATLPGGKDLDDLGAFRDKIHDILLHNKPRPTNAELSDFGKQLFKYIVRDGVEEIYNDFDDDSLIRIHILTNRPDLQSIPWEYLQDPKRAAGPWGRRTVIRVLPFVKRKLPAPLDLSAPGAKLRILFVYADPPYKGQVPWSQVLKGVELKLRAQMSKLPSGSFELTVVEGTPQRLFEALRDNSYDIFHFVGHGEVKEVKSGGKVSRAGQILLLDQQNERAVEFEAEVLAATLRDHGIRLAILSACNTSIGDAAAPFGVAAEALLRERIPAVVANHLPVPISSVATFVGRLYEVLLGTGDVDTAFSEGRIRLWEELVLTQGARLEWGIPTLYRHVAASELLKPPPGALV